MAEHDGTRDGDKAAAYDRLRMFCKGCHGSGTLIDDATMACFCEANMTDALQTVQQEIDSYRKMTLVSQGWPKK